MRTRIFSKTRIFSALAALAAALLTVGCQQYRVDVRVDADGGGRRTVALELDRAAADSVAHLLTLDDGGWSAEAVRKENGDEVHVHSRTATVPGLDGWPAVGGLLVRGDAGGVVRLVSDLSVAQVHRTSGRGYVYRETLRWENLREEVAAHAAGVFASWLGGRQPALPPAVTAELRGVVAAAVVMNWEDLGEDDGQDQLEQKLLALVEDRLLRAGVSAAQAAAVRREAVDCDLMTGIEAELPGLELALESGFELRVTMPGPVTGGNADLVEGNVAVWKIDLARAVTRPLELVAESGG